MRNKTTVYLVLSALLCALTAILSQIQLPVPPIPASLSLLGVHLCGALLSPAWSACALAAYLFLGACGVPVFAGFLSGPSVLFGPTGGFLFGYVLCAPLESALIRRLGFTRRSLLAAMAAGAALCYALGAAWFMLLSGTGLLQALSACVIPFVPGDVLKAVFASSIALRLHKPLSFLGLSA
ncbi:MAG: biotin transporter BioY [Clostridia bacterium]|nr:biotin transporter BioY [Clostridia bacterium]